MAIHVEHELHTRRRGRNVGLLVVLVAFVGIVFGLTVVKVLQLGNARAFEGYDHVMQPAAAAEAEDRAAAAAEEAGQ